MMIVDALVYKHMNVGVSKPSKEIRDEIAHHVVDVVNPSNEFTVSEFTKLAEKATEVTQLHHCSCSRFPESNAAVA